MCHGFNTMRQPLPWHNWSNSTTSSDFLQLKITLPTLAEQRKIAEFFAAVDQEIALQKQRLAQLQAQKKGLMQRLLTGQVRVKAEGS